MLAGKEVKAWWYTGIKRGAAKLKRMGKLKNMDEWLTALALNYLLFGTGYLLNRASVSSFVKMKVLKYVISIKVLFRFWSVFSSPAIALPPSVCEGYRREAVRKKCNQFKKINITSEYVYGKVRAELDGLQLRFSDLCLPFFLGDFPSQASILLKELHLIFYYKGKIILDIPYFSLWENQKLFKIQKNECLMLKFQMTLNWRGTYFLIHKAFSNHLLYWVAFLLSMLERRTGVSQLKKVRQANKIRTGYWKCIFNKWKK